VKQKKARERELENLKKIAKTKEIDEREIENRNE
jgi:hypothetical protein